MKIIGDCKTTLADDFRRNVEPRAPLRIAEMKIKPLGRSRQVRLLPALVSVRWADNGRRAIELMEVWAVEVDGHITHYVGPRGSSLRYNNRSESWPYKLIEIPAHVFMMGFWTEDGQ